MRSRRERECKQQKIYSFIQYAQQNDEQEAVGRLDGSYIELATFRPIIIERRGI